MWTASLMCNKQERNALYSWLCKNNYHCHQKRCQDPITEFYIDCKSKEFSMVGFIGYSSPPSNFMDSQYHILCKGFTQIIGVIQTIDCLKLVEDGYMALIGDTVTKKTDHRKWLDTPLDDEVEPC